MIPKRDVHWVKGWSKPAISQRDAERLHSNLVALRVAAEIRRSAPEIAAYFERPGMPPGMFDLVVWGLIGSIKSELQSDRRSQSPRRPQSQPRPATSGPSGKRKSRAR